MTDKKSEKRKGGDIGGNWRKGSESLGEPRLPNVTITPTKDV